MRSYELRGLTLAQAQQELRERIQKRKDDKKRFAKQGKRKIVFAQTPEERLAIRQARIAAQNKALADDRNKAWFRALNLDNPVLQSALLRVLPVFAPLMVSRLAQDGLMTQQQAGTALEVIHAR